MLKSKTKRQIVIRKGQIDFLNCFQPLWIDIQRWLKNATKTKILGTTAPRSPSSTWRQSSTVWHVFPLIFITWEVKSKVGVITKKEVSKEGWPPFIFLLCSTSLKDDFTHFNFNCWVGRLWGLFLSHHLFSKWWDIFFDETFFITFENRKLFMIFD